MISDFFFFFLGVQVRSFPGSAGVPSHCLWFLDFPPTEMPFVPVFPGDKSIFGASGHLQSELVCMYVLQSPTIMYICMYNTRTIIVISQNDKTFKKIGLVSSIKI